MNDKLSDATAGVDLAAEAPELPKKVLPPAAQRALAEAEARRAAATASVPAAKEFQGPEGPEPTRFGDWERKGIASDF
ncbi:MAG: succinate dehydrogenase assembly factor 4 [Tardiphaga sp.]